MAFERGKKGIDAYGDIIDNINSILKRNTNLEKTLQEYHKNIKGLQKKAQTLVLNAKSMEDGSDPA